MCCELCRFPKKGLFSKIFDMCCVLFRLWNFISKNKKMCPELCRFWKKEGLFFESFLEVSCAVPFLKFYTKKWKKCVVNCDVFEKKKIYFPNFFRCAIFKILHKKNVSWTVLFFFKNEGLLCCLWNYTWKTKDVSCAVPFFKFHIKK